MLEAFNIFLLLASLLPHPGGAASNVGRIRGTVNDIKTGEPLIGVTIVIMGTQRGASTDVDGTYQITAIPVGTYTIRASSVGYKTTEIKGVKVESGRTVVLNFRLASSALQLKGVVVQGHQPVINVHATSSQQTVTASTIEMIPNVKNVQDVIALQPGVVKMGNNLFLRGGRANEIEYLVDGVAVNDILGGSGGLLATTSANSQLEQLYSGVQSGYIGGGTGLAVSANAIRTITVSTSGFDAEYGNAQSGVINIITKSGGDIYTGSAQLRSDRLGLGNSFDESYYSVTLGGPEPITRYLLPMAGVHVPGQLTFFISSDFDQNNGAFTYAKNAFYQPIAHKVQFSGFFGSLLNNLGVNYRDLLNNQFTMDSKLVWDATPNDRFTYTYNTSLGSNQPMEEYWYFHQDSANSAVNTSAQQLLEWMRFFGQNSFFTLYLAQLTTVDGNNISGLGPLYYSSATTNQDLNGYGYNDLGTDQDWLDARTVVTTLKFDLQDQLSKIHELKAGFEYDYQAINSTEIQYPNATNRTIDTASGGLYPTLGLYRWVLNNYPSQGAAYLQDNITYEGMNLHVGLRYDFFYIGKQVFAPDWVSQWERATDLTATWPSNVLDHSHLLYYLTHGYVSPRVSLGFPITDRMVFYFNYGHFYQFPTRDEYFKDPFTLQAGNFVGNPALKPQKTIQYELGVDDQLSSDFAFSVDGFYKDIFDYATTAPVGPAGLGQYLYVNLDYANSRGFDITVNKILTSHFSGSLTYSFQIARGRSSSPYAAVYQPQFLLPRDVRLNWDQNNTINLFLSYRVTPNEKFDIFGLPFINNWGVSLIWEYGSGFPYTPYLIQSARSVSAQELVNSATGPFSSNVNLNFYKGFLLFNQLNVMVTLDVTNLLNRRNPNDQGGGWNTYTGAPDQFGNYDPSTGLIYQYPNELYNIGTPYLFGNPRQVLLGVRLNWE